MSTENPAESERDRPQERANWFMRGRMVDGKPGAEQLHRAYDQKLNNRRLQGLARAGSGETTASPRPLFVPAPAGSAPWNFLGPAPTATAAVGSNVQDYGPAVGRVTAVVVDQTDTTGNTVYVGGASGGLWKSTNAADPGIAPCAGTAAYCAPNVIWKPLIDNQATLTIGSVALQPGNSNLILVGSGEANNSADSYYGLGILRSTDAGATWNLISCTGSTQTTPCPSGTISFHGLGFTHVAFATDRPSIAVATAAAASGGINVGAETGGTNARGIYYSTDAGVTWQRPTVLDSGTSCTSVGRTSPCAPDAGSANAVIYNANTVEKKFFANLRYHGIYSSADGVNWSRLACQPGDTVTSGMCQSNTGILSASACPAATNSSCPLYRAEMAIVPGRDEMYVWIYNSSESDIGIFQTKDGGLTWTQISTTGIDNCGDGANNGCGNDPSGQGTYNIALAAVPNGTTATDLYAGGVNEYKCAIDPISNSTCIAKPFINLTHVYASCSSGGALGAFAHVHPDEHGIDFPVSNPKIIYFGNDGGIYRTLNGFTTNTASCNRISQQQIEFDNLSGTMGSMIQFVGFSHHPSDPTTLVGGTQDNGSPAVSSASPSSGNWLSVNRGDGGFNAINPLNANEWFTSNPAPLVLGGGIQRCTNGISCWFNTFTSVVTQNQIGGDNSSFYTFFTLDPQASGRMLVGSCRVWRGNSDGSQSNSLGGNWSVNNSNGTPLSLNLDTGTTASCGDPQSNPTTFMVNTIAAGGPCNGTCDPGATPGTSTGGGSQVVWAGMEGIADAISAAVQCLPGNLNGTPCGGQVWRTLAADTGTSSWCEVSGLGSGSTPPTGCPSPTSAACTSTPSACNINPRHYTISGIALDPKDATGNTAYVTVMGFAVGHIFKTTDVGATWAMLDGSPSTTGLPDAPADAVVADPSVANLVYIGTDVGAFQSFGDGTWTELGPSSGAGSLPNVAITQLKIYNNSSDSIPLRLRASTYGRGIWEIPISPGAGYTMAISNPGLFAFAGQTATYNGNIAAFNSYTSPINVTCTSGGSAPPSTCPNSGGPVVVSSPYGSFSVIAGNPTSGDFDFNITAVGSDSKTLTQQSAVTFHAVDFSLGSVPVSTVGQGDTADVSFIVSGQGQFTGNVTLTCPSGLPAGTSCTFSPTVVSLTPSTPTANVRLTIPTTSSTTPGPYTVTITGMATLGSATQSHSTPLALTLTVNSGTQSFSVNVGTLSPNPAKPGQTPTATVNLTAGSGYTGTLTLSCTFDSTAGSPGASTCSMNPTSVILAAGQTLPSILTVNTTGALPTNPRVIVTAKDVPNNASIAANPVPYSVVDYSIGVGTPGAIVPNGAPASVSVTLTALNGYTGTAAATCNVPSPVTCALNPAGPYTPNTGATPVATAIITAPANTTAGTYTVNVNTNDAVLTTLIHNQSVNIAVQDFQIASSPSTETVKAGGTPTAHTISITGGGGFTSAVTLSCSSGLPSLTTCTFSPASVAAGGTSTLTIQTTAPSVSQLRLPASHRTVPLYALWLPIPGIVVGIIGIGVAPRNRRGKLLGYLGLVVVFGILLMLVSCGGGGGGSTTTPPVPKPGTPAGTYNITVTGTSGSGATSLSHFTQITLQVN
ncbi:MAG: hypothetical protein WCC59_19910 [Terriglobales bacterium]